MRLLSVLAKVLLVLLLINGMASAQELSDEEIQNELRLRQICFGFPGINEERALEICSALEEGRTVKARELAETWLRDEPESYAAHFSLAEILMSIEGNLARAQYHFSRAEQLNPQNRKRFTQLTEDALWHYMTLNKLQSVHQALNNQEESLRYLELMEEAYNVDLEPFKGWPLMLLGRYEEAKDSARLVLRTNDNPSSRARAWNVLCTVEMIEARPDSSLTACEGAIMADGNDRDDTVYLMNAAEVARGVLKLEQAEDYLERAARRIDPSSVGNPWISLLDLYLSQNRPEMAEVAFDRMLVWRSAQEAVVTASNRAEHLLVGAELLMLAGYPEDAVKLTRAAIEQPDRTGIYTADERQKESNAVLFDFLANKMSAEVIREEISLASFFDALSLRRKLWRHQFQAWRAANNAAALFAEKQDLRNRIKPYAPIDIHIPEWAEQELIELLGAGVINAVVEENFAAGFFALNKGYYHSYKTEVASSRGDEQAVVREAEQAIALLPESEVMLRGRPALRAAQAAEKLNNYPKALASYANAMAWDPSIFRRLGTSLPVRFQSDQSAFADIITDYLEDSPRFAERDWGFALSIAATGADLSVCLALGNDNRCTRYAADPELSDAENAQALLRLFYRQTFALGFEIEKEKRLALLGPSLFSIGKDQSVGDPVQRMMEWQ